MPFALTRMDWAALVVFLLCWNAYWILVDRVPAIRRRSVIAAMDEHRRRWMRAALMRENRIADISAIGNLMSSTSFLANTAIFILGGLLAMLSSPELGRRVLAAMPFAQAPGEDAGWEIRIILMLVIFVNAFFQLTWALRQFNYCSILVGAMDRGTEAPQLLQAETAAKIANRAARHFNSGLRAYYFGLAALAWLVHPLALVLASLLVIRELYRREFRSVVHEALREA